MNLVIGAVVVLIIAAAAGYLIWQRRSGKSSCGCKDCGCCGAGRKAEDEGACEHCGTEKD